MTRQGTRIAALVVGCAVVAGGAFVVTDTLSSSAPATASQQPAATSSAQPAGSTTAGQSAQAAALSAAITDVSGPSNTTASTPAQRTAELTRARSALRRLRLLGGEHGEFTFRTKQGTKTLAFERGTIESVAGSEVTVRAADGTTWTWQLTSTSVVRDDGSRSTPSALSAGELVFAGGPVTGTAHDARLIVIRKPSTSAKSATSVPAAAS